MARVWDLRACAEDVAAQICRFYDVGLRWIESVVQCHRSPSVWALRNPFQVQQLVIIRGNRIPILLVTKQPRCQSPAIRNSSLEVGLAWLDAQARNHELRPGQVASCGRPHKHCRRLGFKTPQSAIKLSGMLGSKATNPLKPQPETFKFPSSSCQVHCKELGFHRVAHRRRDFYADIAAGRHSRLLDVPFQMGVFAACALKGNKISEFGRPSRLTRVRDIVKTT